MSPVDGIHEPGNAHEPAHENDPVARFFAQAREQVEPAATSDLGWQEVLRGKRTARRPTSWYTAVATAAAAVVALFAVWTWQQPMQQHGVTTGSVVTTGAANGLRTAQVKTPPQVSGAQQPSAVPRSFETWSLTNAGSGTLYDFGSSNCEQAVCVTLLRSSDNGNSWTAVHQFSNTDTSSATGSDIPQIQPSRALTQARFASPQAGYVFGGDLWVTHDRGASFTQMTHPGQSVLDVEIWQGDVVVVSADQCAQGTCAGPLYVSRIKASATTIVRPTATMTLPSPISAASAIVHGGTVNVQLTPTKSGVKAQALRLHGSSLVPLKPPAACNGTTLQALTVAARANNLLYAVCNAKQQQQNISYTVVRSTDSGSHWSVRSIGSLVVPRLGQLTLAAGDKSHLVVSMGGPRDPGGPTAATSVGSLQTSSNAGQTFSHVQSSPHLPAGGFDWVASPGGEEFYALSHQDPTYWSTDDNGVRWKAVDPTS
ncbi:hypothetical protein [Leekyejoonella antrihumi]|uniref:Exo-alpha-sialidase n=1 Tax=Leekyejoonella antrihumi TaxID=1660198 RepID=A0A563E337_9MICO|nr:hypothetical protein [Leekyejoonella antrihumi]TWP36947.1 hypothetical protein FGL98_07760 [Leekyejoonella antrihumi]